MLALLWRSYCNWVTLIAIDWAPLSHSLTPSSWVIETLKSARWHCVVLEGLSVTFRTSYEPYTYSFYNFIAMILRFLGWVAYEYLYMKRQLRGIRLISHNAYCISLLERHTIPPEQIGGLLQIILVVFCFIIKSSAWSPFLMNKRSTHWSLTVHLLKLHCHLLSLSA